MVEFASVLHNVLRAYCSFTWLHVGGNARGCSWRKVRPNFPNTRLSAGLLRAEFNFTPSVAKPPTPNNPAAVWDRGYRINVGTCKAAGMSELYCPLFGRGADILLDREWKREAWTQHENYDSLDSEFCTPVEAKKRFREHVREGFAELVPLEPSCVHPLGAPPPPKQRRCPLRQPA